jgi:5'-3' exonuclease
VKNATFNPNIFSIFYTYADTLQLQKVGAHALEADDIVALVLRKIQSTCQEASVVIYTNDNDYLQLRSDGVCIHNLLSPKNDACNLARRSQGTPEIDLCIKALIGDVSDNIPPVCAKIGAKTALKVASMSDAEREAWLTAKGCLERYTTNTQLVSFQNIPEHLASALFSMYNICVL